MNNELSFKELYEVSIKATLPIEVGNRTIEPGETIAFFDKIQLANFQEIKSSSSANGGYNNLPRVIWESTKEVRLNFVQGVFSKTQLALLTNSQLLAIQERETFLVNTRKLVESDEEGKILLEKTPVGSLFVYDQNSGEKLINWDLSGSILFVGEAYKTVIVDYWYSYDNGHTILTIGRPMMQGYLSLTGKMKVKDDITGKVKTGIINIPKLRLMSDLSMRVGSDAIPQVGRLDAVAVPEGARGQQKVMEIVFLNDDIDADM